MVPKIGLVLSSGGARGAAHVGVLKVLEQADLLPEIIVGSSMGAQVGGIYAAGLPIDRLDELWRSASLGRVARTLFPTVPWSGWSSGRAIGRIVGRCIGDPDIETLPICFAAVATDLATGHPMMISRGSLVNAIRASLSVPGLFTPVWLQGRLCVDGGVSCPLPIRFARSLGAGLIIAVDVLVDPSEVRLSGLPQIVRRPRHGSQTDDAWSSAAVRRFSPSVFRVLFQMSTVFQRQLCEAQIDSDPPDVLIRPDFSADPPRYRRVGCAIEAGEIAARNALPQIRQHLARMAES
ncbi:MAG TPA: hypothetical protein ENN96_02275, partial [Candidatus Acetothermia bacterium]|nr:hypothetical protein [Candidatus Acetothermia bacterium]